MSPASHHRTRAQDRDESVRERRRRRRGVPRGLGRGDDRNDECGTVSAMVAVLGLAIFVGLALVVDGGRSLGALTEAQDIADNAARAGSQAVDLEQWRDGGRPVIDRDGAQSAVADFMAASGLVDRVDTWTVVPPADGPDADVTVAVEVTITPNAFFFPSRTVSAVGSANALDGVGDP
ncbi:MAG: Tad domain-containing protein [Actinomycetota bacterium]